jgi:DNA-3-methyladenine glycosylase I
MDVIPGPDGLARCSWAGSAPEYVSYHDDEWGWPVGDDRRLFEKLCLESFQSGLAWITILRKRPAFREVFHDFDIQKVAAMTPAHVERLLADPRIVRHRGKIESAINNAARTLQLQDEVGSLAAFVWAFEPAQPSPMAAQTPESEALSKALKSRGFTWTGPTTAYAFMQAMGLVNDHLRQCHVWEKVEVARADFPRPDLADTPARSQPY